MPRRRTRLLALISRRRPLSGSKTCSPSSIQDEPSQRRKKQCRFPVWQAARPTCSTLRSSASPSQSTCRLFRICTFPLCSPLCQRPRVRLQYTTCPRRSVSRSDSSFMCASIRISPLSWSCAIAVTRPLPLEKSSVARGSMGRSRCEVGGQPTRRRVPPPAVPPAPRAARKQARARTRARVRLRVACARVCRDAPTHRVRPGTSRDSKPRWLRLRRAAPERENASVARRVRLRELPSSSSESTEEKSAA